MLCLQFVQAGAASSSKKTGINFMGLAANQGQLSEHAITAATFHPALTIMANQPAFVVRTDRQPASGPLVLRRDGAMH